MNKKELFLDKFCGKAVKDFIYEYDHDRSTLIILFTDDTKLTIDTEFNFSGMYFE